MQTVQKLKNQTNLQIVPDVAESASELTFDQKILDGLFDKMTRFVQSFEDDYLDMEPWFIFNAWLDYKPDTKNNRYHLFRSWQLFHWRPDPATVARPIFDENAPTIALAYLNQNRNALAPEEIRILESSTSQIIDIYEVIGIQSHYLTLYGRISRTKVMVYESDLTSTARIGEFIFANVLETAPFQSIFIGRSGLLSQECSRTVDDFCDFVKRCDKDVPREFKSFESDVFNLFYDINCEFGPPR